MAINPHPIVLTMASERRRSELIALAGRERLGASAQASASRPPRRALIPVARAVSGIVTVLLAATRQG